MPTFSRDAREKAGQRQRGAHAMQPRRAGEIEEGLVDRQRFDQRRHLQHHRAHLAPDGGIFRHVGLDDHGLGAELQRLEHRHGRPHALDARDVAGGGDDAARAAADDHRLVGQFGTVALLDRGIEGVAVDVGDRKLVQLRVAQQPGAAAGAAAPLLTLHG